MIGHFELRIFLAVISLTAMGRSIGIGFVGLLIFVVLALFVAECRALIVARALTSNSQRTVPVPASISFDRDVQIAGRSVAMWCPKSGSKLPLIVFSHGFGGSKLQTRALMNALAEHGYFVVAPNHKDAGELGRLGPRKLNEFRDGAQWTDASYRDREEDIKAVLDALKKDGTLSKRIDWNRIGLAGHSLGGYTALALAGGWRSWKMPGIKAVLALSPYTAPFQAHGTMKDIDVPVMY